LPASETTDGTTTAAYAYSPDNLRRSKTVEGDTTAHIRIGSSLAKRNEREAYQSNPIFIMSYV